MVATSRAALQRCVWPGKAAAEVGGPGSEHTERGWGWPQTPWAMPGVGLVAARGVLAGLPQPLCVQAQLSAGIFKLTDAELKRGPGKQ